MRAETIGTRIRTLRRQKHWTLQYVGDQLGLSKSGVRRWEANLVNIPSSRIEQLASLFGVSPAELFPDPASCTCGPCQAL